MTVRQARTREKRERERKLQKIREKRRVSRLGASFDPHKTFDHIGLNSGFHPTKAIGGSKTIVCPERMNFSSNFEETVHFITQIQHDTLHSSTKEIFIDQAKLVDLSPASAVMLIAEIQRCIRYKPNHRRLRGNYPEDEIARQALTEIGFYHALSIPKPGEVPETGRYIKVVPGSKTDSKLADKLISGFKDAVPIGSVARKRLFSGLVECMDNVNTHAYLKGGSQPTLFGAWWMAGFVDKQNGKVAFIFYDQGVGIPTTLRTKRSRSLMKYFHWPEPDMLEDAVLRGISRTSEQRRGQGLPSLKDFIDESVFDGYLHVMSRNADFIYRTNGRSTASRLPATLEGTLVAWSVQMDRHHDPNHKLTDQYMRDI